MGGGELGTFGTEAQVEVDSVVYNTVLAACVSAEQLDQVRAGEFDEWRGWLRNLLEQIGFSNSGNPYAAFSTKVKRV